LLHEFWADSLPTSLLDISILLESAGALLQQERALIVSQSDVGSQLQQVCEAQVPRRSTASSVDDGGLGGLQRLEIWTGKSQAPERFGILLRLWSLLL